jgi:two-component system, sensor histidine kinase and response regulator
MDIDSERADIMVVDDNINNLKLLVQMLAVEGYDVRPFPNAQRALKAIKLKPPHLILMDINMPGIDGYEACRRLKDDEDVRDIPVIFLSALSETFDKVTAFECGGTDYITKPFQFDEVISRIRTHMRIHQLQVSLNKQNKQLKEMQTFRDNLMQMIVHDMLQPLTRISGFTQLALDNESVTGKLQRQLERVDQNSERLLQMIQSLLTITRLEEKQLPLDYSSNNVSEMIQSIVKGFDVHNLIQIQGIDPALVVECDTSLIKRVLVNMLSNAADFSPSGKSVLVAAQLMDTSIEISVTDEGPGVPKESQEAIFEIFHQVSRSSDQRLRNSGLGLNYCKLAVEAHGGAVGVDSEVATGSRFWFRLPIHRAED